MLEPNMLRDDTSDVVSGTWNFRDASAPRSSTVLVISAGLVDRVSPLSPHEIDLGCSAARAWASREVELASGRAFPTERFQAWRVSPPLASA